MPDPKYAVAEYTFGSFHGWVTDPMSEDECREFVAHPPGVFVPRPQDELVIFELTRLEATDAQE